MQLKYILLYIFTTPVFFLIDMVWLGLVARNFYNQYLGSFLGPVKWGAAILFYMLFILGIIVFAVLPAAEKNSVQNAILLGALFGFLAYATYDLTNLATLKDWPIQIVIVDMIWGAVLSSSVATISFYIAQKIGF